jgi:hypothetical protein
MKEKNKKTKLRARVEGMSIEVCLKKMLLDVEAVSSSELSLLERQYYEALSQARLLPEASQDKLQKQDKAMGRSTITGNSSIRLVGKLPYSLSLSGSLLPHLLYC